MIAIGTAAFGAVVVALEPVPQAADIVSPVNTNTVKVSVDGNASSSDYSQC